MQFKQALSEISALRLQMARNTEFHGFGPFTLATTGVVAVLAALAQQRWIPDPAADIRDYLVLWAATAALSVVLIAAEAIRRSRRAHEGLADDMLVAAAEQFLPAAFAGVLTTFTLIAFAPGEPVDAAGALAVDPEPRRVRRLPQPAAGPAHRRRLVSGERPRLPRLRPRRARAFAVGDGPPVRHRRNPRRWRSFG